MIDSAVSVAEPAETGPMSDDRREVPEANCADCPHRGSLLASGRCKPGDTCVKAMSGRQIERFFRQTRSEWRRRFLSGFMSRQPCATCEGERLRPEARFVTVGGKRLPELLDLNIRQAHVIFEVARKDD